LPWQQLSISVPAAHAEALGAALEAAGALSVSFSDAADQPILEPAVGDTPLWSDSVVTGLFAMGTDLAEVATRLRAELGDVALGPIQQTALDDRNWELAWTDDYAPMRFGERLWVVPSHCSSPDPEAINVLLDPGLAFGTGTHPSTRLCLEWLAAHPPSRALVVDYGCGSGILGIAALKLGARHVWMVDNDPQALQATEANAEHNGIRLGDLYPVEPDGLPPLAADLLLANILATPLRELAETFAERIKPGGQIVLAGILAAQADTLVQHYAPWFAFEPPVLAEDDWVLLAGQRLASNH